MRLFLRIKLILLLLLSATLVSGHTPLDTGGENNSPETAITIEDPTKSWTLYEELDEVDYYKIHLQAGEELRASLYVSIWGDTHFTPSLVVMGPDIPGEDEPPFLHPEDLGRVIIQGERPLKPEYEPFTPTSYYYVASYRHTASAEGDYYLAVYSSEHSGSYGMALGYRETFTLYEWLKIPIDLVEIHLWEQQPLALLFGPPVLALIIGYLYINKMKKTLTLATIAALLYIASGTLTLAQMTIYLYAAGFSGSALLTMFFVAAQLGLGVFVLNNEKTWITWIGIGVAGLMFWAGWIIGPVLAIGYGVTQKIKE